MTPSTYASDPAPYDDAVPVQNDPPKNLRWWLRVAEVRLRFVVLVLVVVIIVTQWGLLRSAWDDRWHAWLSQPATPTVSADREYFCPMDPGVVTVWPAICPICSMDLVQRKKHGAQLLPEGVVARMQLSPYRIQLAGIRTAAAELRELTHEITLAGMLREDSTSRSGGLEFAVAIHRDDRPLLTQPREATIWPADNRAARHNALAALADPAESSGNSVTMKVNDDPRVWVRVAAAGSLHAGMSVRGVIRVPAVVFAAPSDAVAEVPSGPALLAVPESAVVDHGYQQIVFVESMPGTFDAVLVELGRRCGDYYPVLSGLRPRQRVAVAGAFLIDAESRLNPSLAVSYFGANQAAAERRLPEVRMAAKRTTTKRPTLSPEEVELAGRQKICPVTDLPLNSMGGPVVCIVGGRKVFLCCQGCEPELTKDPAKYLPKLPAR